MMNTRAGDLIIFYLRVSHTGNNVRVRALPGLCLHPKLESLLPRFLKAPEERKRLCVLWTFSRPGPDIHRYLERITRDHSERWTRSGYSQKRIELGARAGISIRKAIPGQGSLLPR
jgi:hypothetical protein